MKKSKLPVFTMPVSVGESALKNSLPQYIAYYKHRRKLGPLRIIASEAVWLLLTVVMKFDNRRKAQNQQNG